MKDIILIIDDAQEDLNLFQAMLEEHGYKVARACDGQEGLQKIKQDFPMVVISDVMMPRMNGYALLKEIRHDHATSKIPVLIVTARPRMADAFLEIGADSFIAKPINGDKFLSEVDKLVHRVKGSRLDDKRIVIFGKNEKTLKDMHEQLETLGCTVIDVKEEQQVIAAIEEVNPDLFLLAVNIETKVPADLLVNILNTWTLSKKVRENPKDPASPLPVKMRIVLYEEEKEAERVWISNAGEIYYTADNKKALIQKCYHSGALGYLNIYSPQDLIPQVQKFLTE